jgi:hypothetical protein
MLCLEAWLGKRCFGNSVRDQQIKVWAKLGGTFLGLLERPCVANKAQTKQDVVSALCSLQAKVAIWLPHTQRGSKHLLVFDGLIQLTPHEFAYNTQSLDAQVVARHLGAAKDLHVLWNEDDSYVERVLGDQFLGAKLNQACLAVKAYHSFTMDREVLFFAELEAYKWKGKPIESVEMRFSALGLGDVSMFPGLRRLTLDRMVSMYNEDFDNLAQCKDLVDLEVYLHNGWAPTISSKISSKITLLKGLTRLRISINNGLSTILSEIGSLGNLTSLDLQGNGFQGCIPPELAQLSKLFYLRIHGVDCKSCIPSEFGDLKNLKTLNLTYNDGLYGRLPSTLNALALLTRLDLSNTFNVIIGDTMERGVWKHRTWTLDF